jgi:hypothetical protein
MRIAMLAPIAWRTPPRHYGPWELVTSLLTEALVARGVDVTLFATLDSVTAARLDGVVPASYNEDPSIDAKVWEYRHLAYLFEQAGRFDVIHNEADFPAHAFANLVDTPIVTTIHGFSSERILPMYLPYEDRVHFVAISEADRHPALRYAATIHHGVPFDDFPLDPAGSENLLFFGRIHPDKGPAEAIRVARATGRTLHMYGIIQDADYHAREVAPHIDADRIRYHGVVGGSERLAALGRARALLHLINFDEPLRPLGDRGDGLRHARHRAAPWFDGRVDRRRRHRLSNRSCRPGRRCDRRCRYARSRLGPPRGPGALRHRSHGRCLSRSLSPHPGPAADHRPLGLIHSSPGARTRPMSERAARSSSSFSRRTACRRPRR